MADQVGSEPVAKNNDRVTTALGLLGWLSSAVAVFLISLLATALLGTNLISNHRQVFLHTALSSLSTLNREALETAPLPHLPEPPNGTPLGRLTIASIDLDQVIVEGANLDQLSFGPGHLRGTPQPGEHGNVVIAGHRTTWGKPFAHLDRLHLGDRISITTKQGLSHYEVSSVFVVSPNNGQVIQSTHSNVLTLITCTPPHWATHRLIVRANLVQSARTSPGAHFVVTPVVESSLGLSTVYLTGSLLAGALVGLSTVLVRKRRWLKWVMGASATFLLIVFDLSLLQHLPAGL